VGLTAPRKNKLGTKCHKEPWKWTDSLDKRTKISKFGTRFDTWNVRSVYRPGSLMTVAKVSNIKHRI
jgi:hypothetical protein